MKEDSMTIVMLNVDMLSSIHANMFPEGERATGEALVSIY